ncbi:hypothetical protein Droror1_Dr00010900 [Drosera rotundifolia]
MRVKSKGDFSQRTSEVEDARNQLGDFQFREEKFICYELPFGGVGASGIGRYHGKYSFNAFSHCKAVLDTSFFVELEAWYPSWNGFKMAFIRIAYNVL